MLSYLCNLVNHIHGSVPSAIWLCINFIHTIKAGQFNITNLTLGNRTYVRHFANIGKMVENRVFTAFACSL